MNYTGFEPATSLTEAKHFPTRPQHSTETMASFKVFSWIITHYALSSRMSGFEVKCESLHTCSGGFVARYRAAWVSVSFCVKINGSSLDSGPKRWDFAFIKTHFITDHLSPRFCSFLPKCCCCNHTGCEDCHSEEDGFPFESGSSEGFFLTSSQGDFPHSGVHYRSKSASRFPQSPCPVLKALWK